MHKNEMLQQFHVKNMKLLFGGKLTCICVSLLQLGPNVSIGTGVTIGAGVRVRESIILHGATLQVSPYETDRTCWAQYFGVLPSAAVQMTS